MTIKFIGGMWRRIEDDDVRSFSTYQDAVENLTAWEDLEPQTTRDDILDQLNKL